MWEALRLLFWFILTVLTMSYEGFITILLTALGVILAALATIIAILAIVGWAGFKDGVRDAVAKQVGPAMEKKLQQYPDAAKLLQLFERVESHESLLDQLQNKLVTPQVPETVATASNTEVQPEAEVSPIASYPGGAEHADNTGTSESASGPPDPDGGAGHS